MKKDINFNKVEGVSIAIAPEGGALLSHWKVILINHNDFELNDVIISSKGYGMKDGKEQKTSTLRHMIEHIKGESIAQIETIDPSVFHLTNQYWVSYYLEKELFDKKFVFLPDSLISENLSHVPFLEGKAVFHK